MHWLDSSTCTCSCYLQPLHYPCSWYPPSVRWAPTLRAVGTHPPCSGYPPSMQWVPTLPAVVTHTPCSGYPPSLAAVKTHPPYSGYTQHQCTFVHLKQTNNHSGVLKLVTLLESSTIYLW